MAQIPKLYVLVRGKRASVGNYFKHQQACYTACHAFVIHNNKCLCPPAGEGVFQLYSFDASGLSSNDSFSEWMDTVKIMICILVKLVSPNYSLNGTDEQLYIGHNVQCLYHLYLSIIINAIRMVLI